MHGNSTGITASTNLKPGRPTATSSGGMGNFGFFNNLSYVFYTHGVGINGFSSGGGGGTNGNDWVQVSPSPGGRLVGATGASAGTSATANTGNGGGGSAGNQSATSANGGTGGSGYARVTYWS